MVIGLSKLNRFHVAHGRQQKIFARTGVALEVNLRITQVSKKQVIGGSTWLWNPRQVSPEV